MAREWLVNGRYLTAEIEFRGGKGKGVTGYGLRVMGYGLRVIGYGLPVTGYGLSVTGHERNKLKGER